MEMSMSKKLKITQWQYNKALALYNQIKDKYFESIKKDIFDYCENEGIDLMPLGISIGLKEV